MKKLMFLLHLLGFLFFVPIMFTYAQQSITLTFTAEHDSTATTIDSVYIINTTRNCQDVVYFPQTSYVLNSTVHIETNSILNSEALMPNYPNPFAESTHIDFTLEEAQNVKISVSDITGKFVAGYEGSLQQGKHTMQFSGGAAGMYVLTLATANGHRAVRLNKTESRQQTVSLDYVGMQAYFSKKSGAKNFQWVPGDQMAFVAFTSVGLPALGVAVISDVPDADTTYLFDIQTNTCANTPYAVDLDGNLYQTVQIGTQCWLKSELRTSTYKNGMPIPYVAGGTGWGSLSSGAWCHVNNQASNDAIYGKLYNGFAMTTGNLCPTGWRVASLNDWGQLKTFLSGNGFHCGTSTSYIGKSVAERFAWAYASGICTIGNDQGTNNASGLSVMPSGYMHQSDGNFYNQTERAYIWTSDVVPGWPNSYYYIFVSYADRDITDYYMSGIHAGHTIRCIKE